MVKPHVAARAARRPAGKLILLSALACAQAAAQAPERTSVLRYASLNGNIRGELHMLPPVSTGPMSPAWSPDGRWIAFAMAGDIWCVPATGGSAEQLTQGPWYHFEPDWSPGGSRIVMTVDTGDGLYLAVLALDGGNVTHLVEGGGVDVQPAWGPEGRFVYFATAAQGMDIHRIEVATGAREAVVAGPGNQYQPRVSAQGVLAYMAPSPGVTGSGGIWTRELQDAGGGGGADPGAPRPSCAPRRPPTGPGRTGSRRQRPGLRVRRSRVQRSGADRRRRGQSTPSDRRHEPRTHTARQPRAGT